MQIAGGPVGWDREPPKTASAHPSCIMQVFSGTQFTNPGRIGGARHPNQDSARVDHEVLVASVLTYRFPESIAQGRGSDAMLRRTSVNVISERHSRRGPVGPLR